MDTADLRRELKKNNIRETATLIDPPVCPEGALCLTKRGDDRWEVTLNERGEFVVNEVFPTEHEACRYFLKHVLKDPTYRNDYKPSDLDDYRERARRLLLEYDFDPDD